MHRRLCNGFAARPNQLRHNGKTTAHPGQHQHNNDPHGRPQHHRFAAGDDDKLRDPGLLSVSPAIPDIRPPGQSPPRRLQERGPMVTGSVVDLVGTAGRRWYRHRRREHLHTDCATTAAINKTPVIVHASNAQPASPNSHCPNNVSFYRDLIFAFPKTVPPSADLATDIQYEGMPAVHNPPMYAHSVSETGQSRLGHGQTLRQHFPFLPGHDGARP
jgi:hypothetical protein